MKRIAFFVLLGAFTFSVKCISAQINEKKIGAWYMYFVDASFKESGWGIQGDLQYRNWNMAGDLEQLLIRSGITYRPKKAAIKLTLGYGNITTGAFGKDKSVSQESRIYQEALFPIALGGRFYMNHRFRYEQRFVEGQDFRTRYRYNIFINIPFNKPTIEDKTVYLAFYNEIFINGQRDIGNGREVEIFDRNRLYIGLGYAIKKDMKIQFGFMRQTTNNWSKNQFQFSFHHKI